MTTMTKEKKTRTAKKATTGSKAANQARSGSTGKKLDSSERETAYLLKSAANAEHLRQSLAELDAGKGRIVSLEDLRDL